MCEIAHVALQRRIAGDEVVLEREFDIGFDKPPLRLDADELEAYNREVNSGDYYRARNALQSLYFAFKENSGYEPDLIGGKLSGNSSDVFRSSQEVMAAMNDPRYLQDPAYTQDVQDKLLRSDVLGPRG